MNNITITLGNGQSFVWKDVPETAAEFDAIAGAVGTCLEFATRGILLRAKADARKLIAASAARGEIDCNIEIAFGLSMKASKIPKPSKAMLAMAQKLLDNSQGEAAAQRASKNLGTVVEPTLQGLAIAFTQIAENIKARELAELAEIIS